MAYTSFFRDADALEAIQKTVIPSLAHWREIRVWDAGCASGEEPYTLAILFAAHLRPFPFRNLDILATDYEESNFPQFAEQIQQAKYSRKDIFWVPEAFRDQYFLPMEDPEMFQVHPEIQEKVRYKQHDLLTLIPPESGKSLIVCKNVLMHFSPENQVKVLEMFYASLVPEGYLAMDGAQKMPDALGDRFKPVSPGSPLYLKCLG